MRAPVERWSGRILLVCSLAAISIGYGPSGLDWPIWGPFQTASIYGLIAISCAALISVVLIDHQKPTRLQRVLSLGALGKIICPIPISGDEDPAPYGQDRERAIEELLGLMSWD